MDLKYAEELLETLAWISVPLDKLDRDLAEITDANERESLKKHFSALLKAFYDIQGEISEQYRDLDPMFGGFEKYALLRKKYETDSFNVEIPSEERIKQAMMTAEAIRNFSQNNDK